MAEHQQHNRENACATLDATFRNFSEERGDMQAYLEVQSRFDWYSARNAILISKKRPDAQKLGDWGYWRDQGVEILRNERRNPVIILEPGKEYTREDGTTGQYYNAKEVFGISQTTARDKTVPQASLDERLLLKAMIAAIAAGGWVAVTVISVICLIGLLIGSCFGIFFSGEDSGSGQTMQTVVREMLFYPPLAEPEIFLAQSANNRNRPPRGGWPHSIMG